MRTEVNYWSKDSQRTSENIDENTPNYIYRQREVRKKIYFKYGQSFLDFISSNGNPNNSQHVLLKKFRIFFKFKFLKKLRYGIVFFWS